jgi:hypothetical protein
MTPEDIEQLKQLKQLLDDGVLTAEEFALQKNLILASPQNTEVANGESQDKSAHTASNASDSPKEVFETSSGEDEYAVLRDMLASGALQAKDFSQETLNLVYGKQEDGLSTKQQNSQSVGGSQGTSTNPWLRAADAIRALDTTKKANVSGTAASSSGTSKTKNLVLTFTAIILVALVVVVSVIVGGSNDSAKPSDADNNPVQDSITVITFPEVEVEVEMGQVWNWYFWMLRCAVETSFESFGADRQVDSRDELMNNVLPVYSYMAGAHKRVAELIEKGDWPAVVQEEMAQMATLQRQYSLLLSVFSRTSPEDQNTYAETINSFDYENQFDVLNRSITSQIGVPWLTSGEPEPVSDCALLDYYEANPPDFSIVPTKGGVADSFIGAFGGLRAVCGAVRDLDVPNGNNPDWNLAYIDKKAQNLWNQIQADELDGPSDSKYRDLAEWLFQTIGVFMQRNDERMPFSHLMVMEECESFGW